MFLQILGIIFLIIVFIASYVIWKFYRLTKQHIHSDLSIAMSVLPPLYMDIEPGRAEEWKEKEQLAFSESKLKKIGATHIGYYCVFDDNVITRISIWNYKNQAVAVIYETCSDLDGSKVLFAYEMAGKLNGGSICITSNQHAVSDGRPENHVILFEETSITRFLRSINTNIPVGKKLIKIKDSMEFFLTCYEDVSEWRWRSEQLKNEKTKKLLSSAGVNITDELMGQLIGLGQSYSVDVNIKRARRKLAKHSKMTIEQWEKIRDRLVIVNESMHVHHLVDAIYDLAGELSDAQEQVLENFQENTGELTDSIEAFQRLLQSMNLSAKRIKKMEVPAKTEVYLLH
ncbi:MAG: hypothetical protein ACRBEE_08315 [Arenicella sp.]